MIEQSTPTLVNEPRNGAVAAFRRPSVSLRWTLRVAQVRLRFLFVLLAGFAIVGNWHVLRNYWETFTTQVPADMARGEINQDTEYFCPMCPGVISEWPTKCSVCNMPLVRRTKSGARQLPDGVLARMQISPYRIHLAGIQTAPVDYQPLAREVAARGIVNQAETDHSEPQTEGASRIVAEIDQREIHLVEANCVAWVVPDVELSGGPIPGRVTRVFHEVSSSTRRVKIEVAAVDEADELWPGMRVSVHIRRPLAEIEPFRSQPADPPPRAQGELQKLYSCAEHPEVLCVKRERCPHDDSLLMDCPLTDLERVAWWCPMHPDVTADADGHVCDQCNGMRLVPRIVEYRPAGEVLSVPESAIIDLGNRRVAFIERMPGMFDAVEVVVGPRCEGYFPVVRGLKPGQFVAATGAFLLDAETRLNPSVAAGYFGASLGRSARAEAPAQQPDAKQNAAIRAALADLSPDERASAERQRLCPITGMPLGSMGAPIKANIDGQAVWLCCAGCEAEASDHPQKTLEKLSQITARP